MYINKRGVKVRNEEAIKGEVKFIISLTGNINNRVYSSTFQLLNEEDGIKAIEELYKLGEWSFDLQKKIKEIPNLFFCRIDFKSLEIPRNEFSGYCNTITDINIYKIDSYGKIYTITKQSRRR